MYREAKTVFRWFGIVGERADTNFMRLRPALTSLLMAILLSLSSIASACEIKCDIMSSPGPTCCEKQGVNQMPAVVGMMPQHSCCGRSVNFSTTSCHRETFANPPALLFEVGGIAAHLVARTAVVPHAPSFVKSLESSASI
ncbi:MAG: hypothetical protein M3O31_04340, partial [Acidobacteriota bacterium]|nr:hypothetical protein [Acidobacteriota bacterium]